MRAVGRYFPEYQWFGDQPAFAPTLRDMRAG